MPLTTCEDCGHELSTAATACPNCGSPTKPACPHCHQQTVERVDGLQGGENAVAIGLMILLIIPGIAYYFDRVRLPYCTNCKRRVPA